MSTVEFMNYVKEEATERLNNWSEKCYLCDLGMILTESENCDNTWSYSTIADIENIKNYWNDCADFFESYKDNFGCDSAFELNPFENPENFFCIMMIEAIASLIGNTICGDSNKLNDMWNNEVSPDDIITDEDGNEITIKDAIIYGMEKVSDVF